MILQAITWSHAVGVAMTLSVGVRLVPPAARVVDRLERPLSPYAANQRANGAFILPDNRAFAHACDVQHLGWLGNWSGPRIETQAMWAPVGYGLARVTNAPVSMAAMTAFNVVRARTIPGYKIDPLGYAASIGSWGLLGATAGKSWRTSLGLWSLTFPWATPWADDPQHCQ